MLIDTLKKEPEFVNAVLSSVQCCIGIVDETGEVYYKNSYFDKTFHLGVSQESVNIFDFLSNPKDINQIKHNFTLAKCKTLDEQKYLFDFLGDLVLLKTVIVYLKSVEKYLVVLKPLYEKSNLQLVLAKTDLFFNNESIGFLVVDSKRKIIDINPKLCKMLGYEKCELLGQGAEIFHINQEHYENFRKEAFEKVVQGLHCSIDYPVKHKNGQEVIVEISGSLLQTDDEMFKGAILWTARDITERVKQKEELKQLNKNLQAKIQQEVSKSIEKEKKYQLQQLSDAKFATIGQLAAGITHEINTPLTYVKGNFELIREDVRKIKDDNLKNSLLDELDSVQNGIIRISSIIDSMREVAQIRTKSKQKTNIFATLITSLTMAFNRSKHIANITVKNETFEVGMDKDKYSYVTYSDTTRIEQVWMIIINNALDELVKIDDFEKRHLRIDMYEENNSIVVSFEDNAGGIDEKVLPYIFDPLVSTKESHGIGIGLNIAKTIVNDENGSIEAFNTDDGACFIVKIPKEKRKNPR